MEAAYNRRVAQSSGALAGKVYGKTGSAQVNLINQALQQRFLHPVDHKANAEDLHDLTRYRTQLLAHLTDAGTDPKAKARIQAMLGQMAKDAKTGLSGQGRNATAALYGVPDQLKLGPDHMWSRTYDTVNVAMGLGAKTSQGRYIGNVLSQGRFAGVANELPMFAAGMVMGGVGAFRGLGTRPRGVGTVYQPGRGANGAPLSAQTIIQSSGQTSASSNNIASKIKSPTLFNARMGQLITKNGGKNSISIRTSSGLIRYDLKGADHFNKETGLRVPTPHVQKYKNNIIPNGPRAGQRGSVTKTGDAESMTVKDARTIEKYFRKKGIK